MRPSIDIRGERQHATRKEGEKKSGGKRGTPRGWPHTRGRRATKKKKKKKKRENHDGTDAV